MPANKQKFKDVSSSACKDVPLLKDYVCVRCKKRKQPHSFSKKELNTYTYKVGTGLYLNAITAKLCCRTCKGEQVHEMQCEGPCGLVKVLDEFSKVQRSTGSRWCQSCINWKEATEPGVVPVAAPNNDIAPDEEFEYFGPREGTFDPEAGYGSDDDYGMPYGAMADLDIGETPQQRQAPSDTATSNVTTVSSTMPVVALRNTAGTRPGSVADTSTSSNPYTGHLNAATASVSGWSAADPRQAPAIGRAYNAWGPSGQRAIRHQNVSSTQETNSISGTDRGYPSIPASSTPFGDAAPSSSASAAKLVAPSRASMAPSAPAARTDSRWAKPTGRKSEQPKVVVRRPEAPIKQAPRAGEDSDDDYM